MEKFLKFFEVVIVLAFYPLWFKWLLAGTLCLIIIVVVIGFNLYPNASNLRNQKELRDRIGVNISVMQEQNTNISSNKDQNELNGKVGFDISIKQEQKINIYIDPDTILQYSIDKKNNKTMIYPVMGYLSSLEAGGPIKPIDFSWAPFLWDFPEIDIKIVNNSNAAIFVSEAVFKIKQSRLDPKPILVIISDSLRYNSLHLCIFNDGWGPAKHTNIFFRLIPLVDKQEPIPDYTSPYPYTISLEDINDSLNVNISSFFKKEGVNFNGLSSLQNVKEVDSRGNHNLIVINPDGSEKTLTYEQYEKEFHSYFGKFEIGGALACGEISYESKSVDGTNQYHKFKFATVVWIYDENLKGLPKPPSYQYKTQFEVEGHDYDRRVNVSQEIKPGETDRFSINIGVDKSSFHKFSLQLVYNGSQCIEFDDIELTEFISRSGVEYLKSAKANQDPFPIPNKKDYKQK
ncbi:MAG: hypothetical protein ABSG67_06500 [Thermoguttaceae bacterium]|jgi:hypothetical protein